ncbi:MAG: sugar phosphate nucleotidyltransferase [Alphaproteobacteria bacterium]
MTRAAETVPVAILAGGRGERLWPDTIDVPKPMIPIGGIPVVWHVIEGFAAAGCRRFAIALGHRGGEVAAAIEGRALPDDRTVQLVDTGENAATGARLRRLRPFLDGDRAIVAYADGLANLDVGRLLAFHRRHRRQATVVTVQRPERFGRLVLDGDRVAAFLEKQAAPDDWISAGFFVLERTVLDRLAAGVRLSLERDVLPALVAAGEVGAYRHRGFWQCMDMPAERRRLEALWQSGRPPWRRRS